MGKLAEFEHQLADVENTILQLEELREDLYKRIDQERENEEVNLTLNKNKLHKLLAVLEHSIISKESVPEKETRMNLLDFKEELSWDICDLFGYNLNEGSIDPNTHEYYTFKSRR